MRFERVACARPDGEFARLAAFEASYLALAAVLEPGEVNDETHPSASLIGRTTARLMLFADDAALTEQLRGVYVLGGWETLDLEAISEWCNRVRSGVVRYLQAT